MPYNKIQDLPKNIQMHLPKNAQTIYLKAFNNALDQYQDEVVACKVAWSAVKKKYKKGTSGTWITS